VNQILWGFSGDAVSGKCCGLEAASEDGSILLVEGGDGVKRVVALPFGHGRLRGAGKREQKWLAETCTNYIHSRTR
jgi:hypothetical protein